MVPAVHPDVRACDFGVAWAWSYGPEAEGFRAVSPAEAAEPTCSSTRTPVCSLGLGPSSVSFLAAAGADDA
ncbi:hypothetical protein PUR49_11360 [Streptomyces sp. BE147]|uniref:hypothetical protein n=1 Tax=Streptomyces sp. BE147 TaxID=3002524 RepID=UPI002E784969|nr:hypothetical protein [Streptomyces sp. BE147]MEE1737089.1 hypothetical protein [Streptomyces sp. BE147]